MKKVLSFVLVLMLLLPVLAVAEQVDLGDFRMELPEGSMYETQAKTSGAIILLAYPYYAAGDMRSNVNFEWTDAQIDVTAYDPAETARETVEMMKSMFLDFGIQVINDALLGATTIKIGEWDALYFAYSYTMVMGSEQQTVVASQVNVCLPGGFYTVSFTAGNVETLAQMENDIANGVLWN